MVVPSPHSLQCYTALGSNSLVALRCLNARACVLQFEKLSQEMRAEGLGFGSSFAAAEPTRESEKQDADGEDVIATLAALQGVQTERIKEIVAKQSNSICK